MEDINTVEKIIVGAICAYILISTYGTFFSKPTVYEFTEFGRTCIVVEDAGQIATWCEASKEAK